MSATPPILPYAFLADAYLRGNTGLHLDADFDALVASTTEVIECLQRIQRDDGALRNGCVTPDALSATTLTLIAGSATQTDPEVDWRPRGTWVTGTLYRVGNIIEDSAFNFMCVVEHVASPLFVTDLVAGKWQQMTVLAAITSGDVTGALGYTPVNRAGDTMTGPLVIPTGSKVLGASGGTWSDAYLAQDLVTIDKGLYSVFGTTASDIAYGSASNVVRTGGAFFTVATQHSAYGASAAASTIFGGNINTIALSGFAAAQVGLEIDLCSYTPNNTSLKFALDLVFSSRQDGVAGQYNYPFPFGTFASAGGGLGNNHYNYHARAINISSGQRSTTGEYCGFTRGLYFNEFSLDAEADAAFASGVAFPIGIDFSPIHYYGGSDPVTAYNLEAAIAFRDLQGIWWNRDPASAGNAGISKIRTHFNPFTLRWVLENTGTERFAIDVTNGNIYQNGVLFGGGGGGLGTNNTWTGTNTFNNTVAIGANLGFTGLSRRITGDFSNATVASRVLVQTSTLNDVTEFGIIPNGTSTAAGIYLLSHSGASVGVVGRMGVDSTGVNLSSTVLGGATPMPLSFSTTGGGMQLNAAGALLVNTVSAPVAGAKLRVNGLIQCDNTAAFSVHRNGSAFNVANATVTAIAFTTEAFDVGGYYNLGSQRYIPPAGKYMLCGAVRTDSIGVDQGVIVAIVYKNGSQEKSGNFSTESGNGSVGSCVTCVVDANGTDYFELRAFQSNGSATTLAMSGQASDTYFQGFRIG